MENQELKIVFICNKPEIFTNQRFFIGRRSFNVLNVEYTSQMYSNILDFIIFCFFLVLTINHKRSRFA